MKKYNNKIIKYVKKDQEKLIKQLLKTVKDINKIALKGYQH